MIDTSTPNNFRFNNGIFGYVDKLQTFKWCGSDHYENYKVRLEKNPNWEFANEDIRYSLNDYGHRCRVTSEINFNNYILFLGCSHTMGVGLKLEDTFPFIVSQKLELDYYNLSMGASGPDIVFYNLIAWLNKFPRPKFIVFQHPHFLRCTLRFKDTEDYIPIGINYCDEDQRDFLVQSDKINYFESQSTMIDQVLETFKIPVLRLYVPMGSNENNVNRLYHRQVDSARDNHFGKITHQNTADTLVDAYLAKYKNANIHSIIRG